MSVHNKIKGEIVGLIKLVHVPVGLAGEAKSTGGGRNQVWKIQQQAVRGERAHDVVVLQQLCCEQLVSVCLAVFISVCAVY